MRSALVNSNFECINKAPVNAVSMLSLIFANVVLREKLIFLSLLNQHPIITFELSLSFELWTQIEAKRQGKIARGGTTGQMLQAR